MAAGIAVGALVAKHIIGIQELDVLGLTILAAVLAAFNAVVFISMWRYRRLEVEPLSHRRLEAATHVAIVVDFLTLTTGLWIVGGSRSPFQAFYIINVVIASLLLSRKGAYFHALLAYLLFSELVFAEWLGWVPARSPDGAVAGAGPIDGRYVLTVLFVQGVLISSTVAILTSLATLLHTGQSELRKANAELARLSAMRRDFLRMVVHDVKSPLSAVGTHLNNLSAGFIGALTDDQARWIHRCQLRLAELDVLLHDFEILAALEHASIGRQAEPVDLASVIAEVVEENADLANAKGHTLSRETPAQPVYAMGVARLLHEAITNLVTNAIKYTPDGGSIVVRCLRTADCVRVDVADSGVGIPPGEHERLFKEFVRLSPKDGEGQPVPGTGLGLSIVRSVATAHNGRVYVKSTPGQGSTFSIELPVLEQVEPNSQIP